MAGPDIKIQKLGDQILRIIVTRIVNGELAPGDSAPSEFEICGEFGVSKTVAREMMGTLVNKRLVLVRQGRKPEVRPAAEWDVFDPLILELQQDERVVAQIVSQMQDVRTILEPEIAARAAADITDEQLAQVRAAYERMLALAGSPDRFLADVEFHVALAAATDNRILTHIMESMRDLMRVSVRQRAGLDTRVFESGGRDVHKEILEALEARDPDAARDAMRAHMLLAKRARADRSTR
ncbi:FadR/GntR family transcriptional regulator [Conexibacter woesei]|nr:FadR/GntR family transcriptional regulator [Conexibacter woesei]